VIHDGTIPISYGNAPVGVPWVRLKPSSARIFAVLFFSHRHPDGTHTLMHSGGWMPDGGTTKILWVIDNPAAGDTFSIHGTNLTGGGTYSLRSQARGPLDQAMIPSIIKLPTPGCWRLIVTVGKVKGIAVMRVVRGVWAAAPSMSEHRIGQTATMLASDQLLVAGGHGCTDQALSDACATTEVFDSRVNTWRDGGSLLAGAVGHTTTLLANGEVLAAGGTLGVQTELYSEPHVRWQPGADLRFSESYGTATLLSSGKVLLAGGYGCQGSICRPRRAVQVYDPESNRWTLTGSLRDSRFFHTATLLPNHQVLVTGGEGCGRSLICASAELYNPATGRWSLVKGMGVPREEQAATLLRDGEVLVAGGYGCMPSTVCASAEIYNPRNGKWRNTGSMLAARAGHTATLLPGGKVLVVGGYGCSGAHCGTLASAELYNPTTGTWHGAGIIGAPREYHTATLVYAKRVLIAGGSRGCSVGGCKALSTTVFHIPQVGQQSVATTVPALRSSQALGCKTTPIQTKPVRGGGFPSVPWVDAGPRAAPIRGFLFIGDRLIHTDGQMPDGSAAKVAWFNDAGGANIQISGKVLQAHGWSKRIPLGNGLPIFPRPGCWRVDVSSGAEHGNVTFLVVGD
jgi:N-acetylneuraminic acid mutarotase